MRAFSKRKKTDRYKYVSADVRLKLIRLGQYVNERNIIYLRRGTSTTCVNAVHSYVYNREEPVHTEKRNER